MHVLVTGGLGFLGHALTLELLSNGHRVTVMSRGRVDAKPAAGAELVTADVRDRARVQEIVRAGDFDGVCHLAALAQGRESFSDPLTYYDDVNLTGTLNVLMALDAARDDRAPAAFVLASTNVVYGSRNVGALSEDLDLHPESPYAASKVAAEQLAAAYAATGAVGAITLRCFNIAGAVDGVGDTDRTRIIPNVFRAMTGELPHVTMNGDGSAVRDFVHVADVAEAFRLALARCEPGQHRAYNVGSGVGASMADVVSTAERIVGRGVRQIRQPPKPEAHSLTADISRSTEDLAWNPTRSQLRCVIADAWEAWQAAQR